MISLNLGSFTRWGLNLLAFLGVVLALRLAEWASVPVVIALLLAAVLWPAVKWLNQSLRIPWSVSCLAIVIGLVLLNLMVTFGLALAVPRMLQGMPNLRDTQGQDQLYSDIRRQVGKLSPQFLDDEYWPEEAEKSKVFNYVRETLSGPYVAEALLRIAYYTNTWLWQWVLVMFILLFLLLEGRMLIRRVVEIIGPSAEVRARAAEALTDMARQVRTYLVWRTIVNFGLGAFVGIVYYFLELKQPWTWALLTAILCYIPYLGPIAAGVPPMIDAFISFENPWYVVGLLVFYVGVITLEGYVVVPVVMGRSMELNATTVMLACLFWELVWGLPGLFLAMPLMAAIKAICYHVPGLRPWANLMGTSDEELPTEEPVADAELSHRPEPRTEKRSGVHVYGEARQEAASERSA